MHAGGLRDASAITAKLRCKRVVTVGEGDGDQAVAFPYSELRKVSVAPGTLEGEASVVFWAPGTASALDTPNIDAGEDVGSTWVFRPVTDGRELMFIHEGSPDAPIRDRETGSTWSVAGIAIDGEHEGTRLEPVVHGDHFSFAWAAFSPDITMWTAG